MKTKIPKPNLKKIVSSILACAIALSVISAIPAPYVLAKESIGNGLILSTDNITITADTPTTFTAVLEEGLDASGLACVVADPDVVSITPIAFAANAAAYQVDYKNAGSTVVAVYHPDNPAVVAYIKISASPLAMEIPSRLGTNHDNYCTLVDFEFAPYDFKYADFNDYSSTLKLRYQCTSYKDDAYTRWGCYGYFYDAAGNMLSKVHLYCSSLSKARIYHSEFNVPVNAVRFVIEGF